MKRATGIAAVTLSLVLTLAGCTAHEGDQTVDTSMTVEQAKTVAQGMETRLSGFVPSDAVASVEQAPTGVLIRCDGDRGYQWTGQTKVVYRSPGSVDPATVVDAIMGRYRDADGFTAESAPTQDGEPGVHVLGERGSGYLVNESVDRSSLEILSFSPCFVLPDGMSPSAKY